MNQKSHDPQGSKKHDHHHKPSQHPPGWQPHRDWRVWTGVVLMLVAMAVYILTQNESIRPGVPGPGGPAPEVPAAPAPPTPAPVP